MKKYRYRKITPEIVEEMKKLREEGMTYKKIGELFNVNASTTQYHLIPEYKKRSDERALKSYFKSEKKLSKEEKRERNKKKQPYISKYMKERYHNDEEYRKHYIKLQIKSQKKRKNE